MFGLLKKIFGTSSERQIKKVLPIVEQINEIFERLREVPDEELKGSTTRFRKGLVRHTLEYHKKIIEIDEQIAKCESAEELETLRTDKENAEKELYNAQQEYLDRILPEAFAVVKEVCRRLVGTEYQVLGHKYVWDMVPFDVQLTGAIMLHRGKVAEMATGEGKTLVATMPLYLNSLAIYHPWVPIALKLWGEDIEKWDFKPFQLSDGSIIPPGRGVHLVTVNDYLAKRDAAWMGPIYQYLGITVGVIHEDIEAKSQQRKIQYLADITYGTNNAFGFDYLRDNMSVHPLESVQREHYYAIVDEVDSILIDEARTPLIISGPVTSTISEKYRSWNVPVSRLVQKQVSMSAKLLSEAQKLWEQAQELESEGKNKEANEKRHEAAVKFLMVKKSTPKNPQFLKLIKEPDILKSVDAVESEYVADSKMGGDKMQKLDEELYIAIDEHERSVNLTDKGRLELAKLANTQQDIFILPNYDELIAQIQSDETIDEKEKQKRLQEVSKTFAERSEINHSISQLLKAYIMFARDVDYVVQEGKVIIVDEFTGRLMPGRRYSEGLHQALEAKEGVKVEGETQTYAQITLQNYFRMYRKLAGMTGTAMTEASEFWEIYKLDVVSIPTNRPVRRIDFNDQVYMTRAEKFNAVMNEIQFYHSRGQPVLVGTTSVEVSETLSRMLSRKKIQHSVLNAKYHEKEAEIVATAGQPGNVTIATNMAGRGTDIKLGVGVVKAYEYVFRPILEKIAEDISKGKSYLLVGEDAQATLNLEHIARSIGLSPKVFSFRDHKPADISSYLSRRGQVAIFEGFELATHIPKGEYCITKFFAPRCAILTDDRDEFTCPQNPKECTKIGVPCGLHIIGTERHESRRIDNQLRGRAGRQGDPGSSRFFLSLQDDLMRLYAGGDRAYSMLKRLNPPEGQPIEHPLITRQIAAAQKRVETMNFGIRKRLLEYDDVMNRQRDVIYSLRRNILSGTNVLPEFKRMMWQFCEKLVDKYTDPNSPAENWDWDGLSQEFSEVFLVRIKKEDISDTTKNLVEELYEVAERAHKLKENIIGAEDCRKLERIALLISIDILWMENMRGLDDIKEGSYLAAYAQKDPLIEYKREAFSSFEKLMDDIVKETLTKFFHAPVVNPARQPSPTRTRARR